jgi:hypothetical protein
MHMAIVGLTSFATHPGAGKTPTASDLFKDRYSLDRIRDQACVWRAWPRIELERHSRVAPKLLEGAASATADKRFVARLLNARLFNVRYRLAPIGVTPDPQDR